MKYDTWFIKESHADDGTVFMFGSLWQRGIDIAKDDYYLESCDPVKPFRNEACLAYATPRLSLNYDLSLWERIRRVPFAVRVENRRKRLMSQLERKLIHYQAMNPVLTRGDGRSPDQTADTGDCIYWRKATPLPAKSLPSDQIGVKAQ